MCWYGVLQCATGCCSHPSTLTHTERWLYKLLQCVVAMSCCSALMQCIVVTLALSSRFHQSSLRQRPGQRVVAACVAVIIAVIILCMCCSHHRNTHFSESFKSMLKSLLRSHIKISRTVRAAAPGKGSRCSELLQCVAVCCSHHRTLT